MPEGQSAQVVGLIAYDPLAHEHGTFAAAQVRHVAPEAAEPAPEQVRPGGHVEVQLPCWP